MSILDEIRAATVVEVHRGGRHLVERAQGRDGATWILKRDIAAGPGHEGGSPLRVEYEILRRLEDAGVTQVARPVALLAHEGSELLVLEDAGPRTLDAWLRRRPLPIDRFLEIATQLTDIVRNVHRHRIVHRDLNPSNVVVSPDAERLTLVDFGHAAVLTETSADDRDTTSLSGTLGYIAPEHTGPRERQPDHRADLYSLGATLYEALTGSPPFSFADPAELIHAHLALPPLPPAIRNPAVPEVLSSIVLRLLAKMPEERYQSAEVLLADLLESARQWKGTGTIAHFELARVGAGPGRGSHRLYGRQDELAQLQGAVAHARAGACELVFISGPAGIGKSSLVQALRGELGQPADAAIRFLSGKCEERGSNIPYAPFVQALRGFFAELLAQSVVEVAAWRAHLSAVLEGSAAVIAELVPELGQLLGQQLGKIEPVAGAGARAIEARTRRAFELTVDALANLPGDSAQAAIIHIDDLQWADPDSLGLIDGLGRGAGSPHLLFLGGFRPDEIGEGHPLRALLVLAPEVGAARRVVQLGPLALESLTALCAGATGSSLDEAQSLARLVLRKTAGNPFFALRFVQRLQTTGILRFDPDSTSWKGDPVALEAATVTENVADLLIALFAEQPVPTRAVLGAASCLRGPARLDLLAAVIGQSPDETARRLWPALREGLIVSVVERRAAGVPKRPLYRFAHDRIQAAAYSMLSESTRPQLHLALGRQLRVDLVADAAAADAADLAERLFDVVDQLNQGVSLIVAPLERADLCELNRRAAERARRSGALVSALAYARQGIALLPDDAWQTQPDTALGLHRLGIECGFFTGDVATGEALFAAALDKVATRIKKADLCGLRVSIESARGEQAAALAVGRTGLRLLDIDFGANPSVAAELEVVRRMLADLRQTDLAELRQMDDPLLLTTVGILLRMGVSARLTEPAWWALIVIRIVRLSLEHGRSAGTAYGYVGVGILLADLPDDDGAGEALARWGVELARAERDPQIEALVLTTFVVMSNRWRAALRSHAPLVQRAIASALESGEFTLAGHAISTSVSLTFHCGFELARVAAECTAGGRLMRRTGPNPQQVTPDSYSASILALQSGSPATPGPAGVTAKSTAMPLHPMRLVVPVLLRRSTEIAAVLPLLADRLRGDSLLRDTFAGPWMTFYVALAAAMMCDEAALAGQKGPHEIVIDNHRILCTHGARCPDNFQHRADLVAAEIARLEGRLLDALPLYDRAILGAQRAKILHEEALARELAGRCRLGSPLEETAVSYLTSARDSYARWGALAKVAALDEEFPHGEMKSGAAGARRRGEGSDAVAASELDLQSFLKAAESISSEVDLDRLLERLVGVCLEVAGARRGVLVLQDREGLAVRAVGTVAEPVALERTELGVPDRVPRTLIEHVFHSGETVALTDAARSSPFSADPYIVKHEVRSLLAVPIVRHAQPIGVCYLENDLSSYGFSGKKVRILTLLMAQIGSALENSRLFGDLRVEIKERTRAEQGLRFLAEASAALAQSLDQRTTLAEVARLAVPFLADWCTVDMLEADGHMVAVAAAHRDPGKAVLLNQLRRDLSDDELDRLPSHRAVHSQVAVLDRDVFKSPSSRHLGLRAALSDPRRLAALQEIGDARSVVTMPLIARGRALGVIMLVSTTIVKRYGPAEVALAEELARRAALAIDNARLYQEAQEAVRLREEFLAVASHELNTPIASLRLVAQALAPDRKPPSIAELGRILGVIDRQTAKLAALIAEMLDVARVRVTPFQHRREPLDLGAVVEETVAQMVDQLRSARCSLSLQIEPKVIGSLDRAAIGRIVGNLLSNAIKFGPGHPIAVSVRSENGWGYVVVVDQGIGVDPARLPRIFDRFARAVPAEHYGGLGLGLYIVHELVNGLGGSIDVVSAPDQGSTFTIRLPLHASAREDSVTQADDALEPSRAGLRAQ